MMTSEQINYLLPKAVSASLRAGAVIMGVYKKEDYEVVLKSDHTPLTIADRLSHNLIKDYLGQTRIPLLSEEGREMLYEERMGWDMFWMVDPLDGTKEFIDGNNEFTVNIALMVDNRPELAVIYVPYIQKLYYAVHGGGAFLCESVAPDAAAEWSFADLTPSARRLPLAAAANAPVRVAISRSHNTEDTFRHVELLRQRYPDAEVVKQGSSYKFCMLAEGAVEFYVRTSDTYEWDTAAGELILSESGGSTVDLATGTCFSYNKKSLVNPHFVCRSCHFPAQE